MHFCPGIVAVMQRKKFFLLYIMKKTITNKIVKILLNIYYQNSNIALYQIALIQHMKGVQVMKNYIYDFESETEKRISFFQRENNCVISIYEENGVFFMNVLFLDSLHIVQDIELSKTSDNKYKLINAMRAFFKGSDK